MAEVAGVPNPAGLAPKRPPLVEVFVPNPVVVVPKLVEPKLKIN